MIHFTCPFCWEAGPCDWEGAILPTNESTPAPCGCACVRICFPVSKEAGETALVQGGLANGHLVIGHDGTPAILFHGDRHPGTGPYR